MALTERPASWKFEIEMPEMGNPDSITVLSAEPGKESLEAIFYDGQVFEFTKSLSVSAEARWAGEDVSVSVSVETAFSSPCSRCLAPSDIEIMNDFMYLYSLRKNEASGEKHEEDDSQVVTVSRWTRFLDISDQVWESVILSLPRQVLCSKDCRGLCPFCGKPLKEEKCGCSPDTQDPRFQKLLGIRIEETQE